MNTELIWKLVSFVTRASRKESLSTIQKKVTSSSGRHHRYRGILVQKVDKEAIENGKRGDNIMKADDWKYCLPQIFDELLKKKEKSPGNNKLATLSLRPKDLRVLEQVSSLCLQRVQVYSKRPQWVFFGISNKENFQQDFYRSWSIHSTISN